MIRLVRVPFISTSLVNECRRHDQRRPDAIEHGRGALRRDGQRMSAKIDLVVFGRLA